MLRCALELPELFNQFNQTFELGSELDRADLAHGIVPGKVIVEDLDIGARWYLTKSCGTHEAVISAERAGPDRTEVVGVAPILRRAFGSLIQCLHVDVLK